MTNVCGGTGETIFATYVCEASVHICRDRQIIKAPTETRISTVNLDCCENCLEQIRIRILPGDECTSSIL